MLFRVFEYSKNQHEAKLIFEHIISEIQNSIISKEYKKIEPYWKVEGIHIVEVLIKLNKSFNKNQHEEFLRSISDKWISYGDPVNEIIASETTEGCNYIKKDVSMINIFY